MSKRLRVVLILDFKFQIWPRYVVPFHENDERALSQGPNLTSEIKKQLLNGTNPQVVDDLKSAIKKTGAIQLRMAPVAIFLNFKMVTSKVIFITHSPLTTTTSLSLH
jgi:hypothetical protein